jgi:hypothetical protein
LLLQIPKKRFYEKKTSITLVKFKISSGWGGEDGATHARILRVGTREVYHRENL